MTFIVFENILSRFFAKMFDTQFQDAVDFVNEHKTSFSKRVSRAETLRFYALYKIATCSPKPNIPRPSGWLQSDRIAMWDSWDALDMSKEEAMREYIMRVNLLQKKF